MEPLTIARSFAGLNNRVDPARLIIDLETGLCELNESVNIRFDERGRGKRRSGFSLRHGGNFHSLWTDYPDGYVGLDDSIYRINRDISLTGVVSGLAGSRISFCKTPLGVYYANGTNLGLLSDDVSRPWLKSQVSRENNPRHYTGAPTRSLHLELFSQRILASVDNVLYRSQPNDYGLYRVATDYSQFASRIRMVRAVAGGVYVSDDEKTYFLQGNDPAQWNRLTVMQCPAMEWSDMTELVSPKTLGLEGDDGHACWVSAEGLVFGSPLGQIHIPTLDKIKLPAGFQQGAAVMQGRNFTYNAHQ